MQNDIPTKIIRSKRRTLTLTIGQDATLVVQAPRLMPKFIIDQFIKEKEAWIQKQLERVHKQKIIKKQYIDGETYLYLGMELPIEFSEVSEIKAIDKKLLFPFAMQFKAKQFLQNWYKKQARLIITQQLNQYAKEMQVSYTGVVTFSDTQSQWGRCTHDNRLQFNWRLIMAPVLVINYVVIHELAHTVEKNHSRAFWQMVKTYCPSYNRQRKWLKENGNLLRAL